MANQTSKIEQLINELCPNGVEYKELWEITNWDKRFNGISNEKQKKILSFKHISANELKKLDVKNGNIKLLATGKFDGWTTEELCKENINEGEIISIPSGGSANLKYYKGRFVDSGNILASSSNENILNLKYCYYFLLIKNDLIEKNFRGPSVKHPDMSEILKIKIPIPPLQIQEEIVKILDSFMELEAELEAKLEAELEARKKQYEFYRDELLTFGEDVEYKELGEFCLKTENIKWKDNQNINYKYIDLSSVSRENNEISGTIIINSNNAPSRAKQIVKEDDVIFGTTRPTLKRYSLINSIYHNQICSTGFCVLRTNKKKLLPKFLFFILKGVNFYNYVEINQEGASYPSISNTKILKYKIPIPSISEQERIVAILDKFDTLVNDISIGLPAELNARRKQYEYYREKLLTFKEVKNNDRV